MSGRLPVVVLTGFLGSGKTTLLKRIVEETKHLRIGVVLNEIGVAGIDAVSASAFAELSEACACCVRSDDFTATMQTLAVRGDLDLVVLETTGIADPLPIMWRIEPLAMLTLECVLTTVDPSTAEAFSRDEWIAQVQAADWIVLTKTDLVTSTEASERAVREVQPAARFLPAARVIEVLASRPGDLGARELPVFAVARHGRLRGIVLQEAGVFSAAGVEACFEALPSHIVRAKAIVRTPEGWLNVQRVGARMHVEEDVRAPEHGESRFVFFSESLDRIALTSALLGAKLNARGLSHG